jgi:hypothetical protein
MGKQAAPASGPPQQYGSNLNLEQLKAQRDRALLAQASSSHGGGDQQSRINALNKLIQNYGKQAPAAAAPVQRAVPQAAAAVVPTDNRSFQNIWSAPVPELAPLPQQFVAPVASALPPAVAAAAPPPVPPTPQEAAVDTAKATETTKAQAEADTIALAKKQRDQQRKARGFGLGAFLTTNWQSVTQNNPLRSVMGV